MRSSGLTLFTCAGLLLVSIRTCVALVQNRCCIIIIIQSHIKNASYVPKIRNISNFVRPGGSRNHPVLTTRLKDQTLIIYQHYADSIAAFPLKSAKGQYDTRVERAYSCP